MAGPQTQVIRLDGATVLPGLVESHGHLHEMREKHDEVDLSGVKTESEIQERLKTKLETPPGEWIVGRGRDRGRDEGAWVNSLPNKKFLDEMFPENPVVLKGMQGFATLGNDKAFDAAGITEASFNPNGGELVRDSNGEFAGVFLNNNIRIVRSGTLMAAPHVTAAAALYWAMNAGLTPAQVESGLLLQPEDSVKDSPKNTTSQSVSLHFAT